MKNNSTIIITLYQQSISATTRPIINWRAIWRNTVNGYFQLMLWQNNCVLCCPLRLQNRSQSRTFCRLRHSRAIPLVALLSWSLRGMMIVIDKRGQAQAPCGRRRDSPTKRVFRSLSALYFALFNRATHVSFLIGLFFWKPMTMFTQHGTLLHLIAESLMFVVGAYVAWSGACCIAFPAFRAFCARWLR